MLTVVTKTICPEKYACNSCRELWERLTTKQKVAAEAGKLISVNGILSIRE